MNPSLIKCSTSRQFGSPDQVQGPVAAIPEAFDLLGGSCRQEEVLRFHLLANFHIRPVEVPIVRAPVSWQISYFRAESLPGRRWEIWLERSVGRNKTRSPSLTCNQVEQTTRSALPYQGFGVHHFGDAVLMKRMIKFGPGCQARLPSGAGGLASACRSDAAVAEAITCRALTGAWAPCISWMRLTCTSETAEEGSTNRPLWPVKCNGKAAF